MAVVHKPLLPGERFHIRPEGEEHQVGDIDCPACGVVNGIRYPHPHRDGALVHLEFLVHGEAFRDAFDQFCEDGCMMSPIVFAPKLSRKAD
jgi:hypothetical protein